MSDFLTRLASRALRQLPTLEPLVASQHATLGDGDAADDDEWLPPSAHGRSDSFPSATALSSSAAAPLQRVVIPTARAAPARAVTGTESVSDVANGMTIPLESRALLARGERPTAEDVPVDGHVGRDLDDHGRVIARDREVIVVESPHSTTSGSTSSDRDVELVSGDAPTRLADAPQDTARVDPPVAVAAATRDILPRLGASPSRSVEEIAVDWSQQKSPQVSGPQPAESASSARHQVFDAPAEPPTITVTIGRIEVRPPPPPQAPRPTVRSAGPRPSPRMSLDAYLAQRNGNQR